MKSIVKFNFELEVSIETEKDFANTSVLELELKASNLGNCLLYTIKHMDTHKLLNSKINNDYKATIINFTSKKQREIIIS